MVVLVRIMDLHPLPERAVYSSCYKDDRIYLKKKFGTMVALKGTQIVETTLAAGVASSKTLDLDYYKEASTFFR